MGRLIDETGNVFGQLTAVSRAKGGWLCSCACGGEAVVRGPLLRSGGRVSCGCMKIGGSGRPARDETGNRYGLLVVLSRAEGKPAAHWLCRCECGGEVTVRASKLRNGSRLTCGCSKSRKVKDESGKRYGMLTVSRILDNKTEERPSAKPGAYWVCVCDCGGESVVRGSSLRGGKTTSCGCKRTRSLAVARFRRGCSSNEACEEGEEVDEDVAIAEEMGL